MNFLLTNKPQISKRHLIKDSDEKIQNKKINGWDFWSSSSLNLKQTNSHFSIIDGYIKDLNLSYLDEEAQVDSCLEEVGNWPLPQNITGSFSCTRVDCSSSEIILCNDLIGIYPLYYLNFKGYLYISNSIIWLGAVSGAEIDETGIFQRSFGPEYCNLGRRTILKNCKRLLPGEWLKFNSEGVLLETRFDNSLYSEISPQTKNKTFSRDYWSAFKKELEYCLGTNSKVNVALSGGMDSRILLGGIAPNKKITCLTYGEDKNYETKIAKNLAKIKGTDFNNFHYPSYNFPQVDLLRKYTLKTEGVYLCSWLEILENIEGNNEPLLIGDLSTAITGRTIKRFSSKSYQKSNFFNHILLNQGFKFELNTEKSFEDWKKNKIGKFKKFYLQSNIDRLGLKINLKELKINFDQDISVLFDRIKSHNLPFIELVDELFTWYTHTRFPMGKQVLLNNSKFKAYCPALSLQIIRIASNVHPSHRLNLGCVRKLFKEVDDLKALSKVPTSQVPIVPMNFPHWLRIPVWGVRTKIDDYLIKSLVRKKDPSKRYRLFNSNNWVLVYQNEQMEKNLADYFKINYLGEGYIKSIKNQALGRKELIQWPFANMNIMNAAALNTELRLIFHPEENYEV